VLLTDAALFIVTPIVQHDWSVRDSLPLALCDIALLVAAVACWAPSLTLAVELTYFWGLAGTLQAVATPDLDVGFPHLEFFEYVAITAGYTAATGCVDWLTGSNYMFLARLPARRSLLSVLGPWPWYVLSAAGVALVLLVLLDTPFRRARQPA
jgi:uncharacterized membrane protein YwaF